MGCRGDVVVCHGWYHGHAAQKSNNSVEPCFLARLTDGINSRLLVLSDIFGDNVVQLLLFVVDDLTLFQKRSLGVTINNLQQ